MGKLGRAWVGAWVVHGIGVCQTWGVCLNDGGFGCLCFGVPGPVMSFLGAAT